MVTNDARERCKTTQRKTKTSKVGKEEKIRRKITLYYIDSCLEKTEATNRKLIPVFFFYDPSGE